MKELKYENRRNKIKITKGKEAVYKKIHEKEIIQTTFGKIKKMISKTEIMKK